MEDFKLMLQKAHELGMYVIIDWTANHTSWNHAWIEDHPDWYTQTDGQIKKSLARYGNNKDSYALAQLNFDNQNMRSAMMDEMLYWVNEIGVDGFHMDVVDDVPLDFWKTCSETLFAAGEILMLAEGQVPDQLNNEYFHCDYGSDIHQLMNEIAKGEKDALALQEWLGQDKARFKKGFHMMFTSNHDENTWAGTVIDRMGQGHKAFAVLAATLDGMPLCYSGQESANMKRLEFFEKDVINWGNYPYAGFYTTLFDLKHKNKALWNGEYGGQPIKVTTSNDRAIFAYLRVKDGDSMVAIINLSDKNQVFNLVGDNFVGTYKNVFEGGEMTLEKDMQMNIKAWEYIVLSNK